MGPNGGSVTMDSVCRLSYKAGCSGRGGGWSQFKRGDRHCGTLSTIYVYFVESPLYLSCFVYGNVFHEFFVKQHFFQVKRRNMFNFLLDISADMLPNFFAECR
jgi:hypothetical protein